MTEPLHGKGFEPDDGSGGMLAADQELNVEMKGRPDDPAGHLVLGQQQRIMIKIEMVEPALFGRLAQRGIFDRGVGRLEVAAGLQPSSDPAVQGEQNLTVLGADQRAGGQMRSWAGARPTIGMIIKMIKVAPP